MTFACPGFGCRSSARFRTGGGSFSFRPAFAFSCAGFGVHTARRLTRNIRFGGVGPFALVTFSGALLSSGRALFGSCRVSAVLFARLFCRALLFAWRLFRLLRKRRSGQSQ